MKILRGQKGAAAVEFAIILPILVVLLFGIIEFGVLLYDKAVITNASRVGARAGTVFRSDPVSGDYAPLSNGEITNIVTSYLSNHLITFGSSSPPTITAISCQDSGDLLPVTVQYHYDFLVLPNFIASLAGGINIGAEAVMRCE